MARCRHGSPTPKNRGEGAVVGPTCTRVDDRFAALRHPGVMRFAAGRFGSALAANMSATAVGWQLYDRTGSRLLLGVVGLVEFLPVALLAVPAGVWADRFSRVRIATAAHLLLAACTATLAWLTWTQAPVWLFYVVLALMGVGIAFRAAAVPTLLPLMVPPRDFAQANAYFSSTFELAAMAGPALGGFLIAWAGHAGPTFLAASAAHLAFTAALATLPPVRATAPSAKVQRVSELWAGLAFILRARPFLAAITLDLFAVLLAGATALLPVFAKDVLHQGPEALGWLRAAPAAGALSMALVQTRLRPWKRPGHAMIWTVVGFGLATVAFGVSTSLALSLVALFLTGAFDNVSVVIRSTLEQALTPDALRGRVAAFHHVFIGVSNELGTFESGAAAAAFGPVGAVVGGGVGCLLVVALVAWRFPELLRLPPLHQLRPLELEATP